MCGFFTAEATEDCLSMVQGIVRMAKYQCGKALRNVKEIYFIGRRISQDNVENSFATVKLGAKHGRLDHITTNSSCMKANVNKQLKINARNLKKRNIEKSNIEEENDSINFKKRNIEECNQDNEDLNCEKDDNDKEIIVDKDELITDHVDNCKVEAMKIKVSMLNNEVVFAWTIIDGEEVFANM